MKVLKARRLVDGDGEHPIVHAQVHVDGPTITYAGPAAAAPVTPAGVQVVDLGERTLLPGLIDAHVHLAGLGAASAPRGEVVGTPTRPAFAPPGTGTGESPLARRTFEALRPLRQLLRSGVTTARDVGAPGSVGFDLRSAVHAGVIEGPRLLVAGRVLSPTGGHMFQEATEADSRHGVRRAVRELFREGADFIKLTASGGGGTAGTDMGRPTYTTEELRAAAEEARQRGSYVTAHCHSTEAIERCLDADIPMLEHATFFTHAREVHYRPHLGRRLRDQAVVVSPTLAVHSRRLREATIRLAEMTAEERAYWRWVADGFQRRLEIVNELHELGVRLIVGSDAPARGVGYHDFAHGIELHTAAGVPAMTAIRSATSTAADALGIGGTTGRLRAGLDADLIAVDGDPIQDIGALQRVAYVMQQGQVAVDETGVDVTHSA